MTTSEPAILVDTSCWIEYFHHKGSAKVKSQLRGAIAADRVAVCGPVICEVLRGAPRADRPRMRRAFDGQIHLSQEDSDWRQVEEALAELHGEGLQPPILDVLISIIAKRHATGLWHFGDRHFDPIGQVLGLEGADLKG